MGRLGNLNTQWYSQAVYRYGEVPAKWYRDIGPCPNPHVSVLLGSTPDMSCPICGGTGRAVKEMQIPLSGNTLGRLLIYNVRVGRTHAPIDLEDGDLMCDYVEPDFTLAEGDRLLLQSRVDDWGENLVRGTGPGERLQYRPARQILHVYIQGLGEITGGYSLDAAGETINWTSSLLPGAQYTVRYQFWPSFVVVRGSHHRRPVSDNGDRFPTQCVLRKWFSGHLDHRSGTY